MHLDAVGKGPQSKRSTHQRVSPIRSSPSKRKRMLLACTPELVMPGVAGQNYSRSTGGDCSACRPALRCRRTRPHKRLRESNDSQRRLKAGSGRRSDEMACQGVTSTCSKCLSTARPTGRFVLILSTLTCSRGMKIEPLG